MVSTLFISDLTLRSCDAASYHLPGMYFRTYNFTSPCNPNVYPYFNRTDTATYFGITKQFNFTDDAYWSTLPPFLYDHSSFVTFFNGSLLYSEDMTLNISLWADDWALTFSGENAILPLSYYTRDEEFVLMGYPARNYNLSVTANTSLPLAIVFANRVSSSRFALPFDENHLSTVSVFLGLITIYIIIII